MGRSKRAGGQKISEVTQISAGDYILPTNLNRLPNKLAGMCRGPMVITAIDRIDLVKVRDFMTNKEFMVCASRLRPFNYPKDISRHKIESLAASSSR